MSVKLQFIGSKMIKTQEILDASIDRGQRKAV